MRLVIKVTKLNLVVQFILLVVIMLLLPACSQITLRQQMVVQFMLEQIVM